MFLGDKIRFWVLALVASAFLLGAGLAGAWAWDKQKRPVLAICIVVGTIAGACQIRIGTTLQKNLEQSRVYQAVKEVYGNLEAAHHVADFSPPERITLYVPERQKPSLLVQMVPYVPTKKFGPFKGGLDVSKGITGLCFRVKEVTLNVLKPGGDFRKTMIKQYGFTQAEANKLESDKKSYLAIPVFDRENKVAGVVFCDSTKKKGFHSTGNRAD